ncbi:MAG TPA: ABC transporter ATP-binding protein [Rhodoblastus sp.]|nr:ABC transporter ATP-binding protein [Rhodoblastus sp.]
MTGGLAIRQLRVRYGRVHVVHGVDIDAEEGSVTALLGANGAGKSTVMRAIMGQRLMEGSIAFAGKSIDRLKPHEIVSRGIALAPEGRMVFPSLSILNNLKMGAYWRGGSSWRLDRDLDDVLALFPELEAILDRPAGITSGGQQQMIAIGRALMARPKLLILDEPSLGLAPLVTERIYQAIRQLKQGGTSILLAEQNAHLALGAADIVYVLETGRVAETGSVTSLANSSRIADIYLGGASQPIAAEVDGGVG